MGKSKDKKRSRSRSRDSRGLEKRLKLLEQTVKDQSRRLERRSSTFARARSPSTSRGTRSPLHTLSGSSARSLDKTGTIGSLRRASSSPESPTVPATSYDSDIGSDITAPGAERPTDNLPPPSSDAVLDIELDAETLNYLGEDPSAGNTSPFQLHQAVCSRWSHILSTGLNKDQNSELVGKYNPPKNCQTLKAPILNPEVSLLLPDLGTKKEKRMVLAQHNLSAGITAVGRALNSVLSDEHSERRTALLGYLGDAGRILTNVHYILSLDRRSNISSSLSKTARELAFNSPVDEYLLGKDFGEKYKTAKLLEKSSQDLKPKSNIPRKEAIPVSSRPRYPLNRSGPSRVARDARHKGRPQIQERNLRYRNRRNY